MSRSVRQLLTAAIVALAPVKIMGAQTATHEELLGSEPGEALRQFSAPVGIKRPAMKDVHVDIIRADAHATVDARSLTGKDEPSAETVLVRALEGFVIGGLAGGAIGYTWGKHDERNCQQECGVEPTLGLVYGAMAGATLGLLVGIVTAY